jgi:hypothetical protein
MKTSDQINELAAALARAQGEMTHAEKTKTNPHFRNDYADIAAIIEAIRIPFSKNGLSYAQMPTFLEGKSVLATRMMHSSGQWIESHTPILASKADAQGFGSGLTYARRYALAAIAGIAQDDDDANAAVSSMKKNPPKKAEPQNNVKTFPKNEAPVSQEQIKMLFALAGEKGIRTEPLKAFIEISYGAQSTKELKVWQVQELVGILKTKTADEMNVMLIEKQQQKEQPPEFQQ